MSPRMGKDLMGPNNFDIADDYQVTERLDDTRSSVDFILSSLATAFEMKPKQATGLLTNN